MIVNSISNFTCHKTCFTNYALAKMSSPRKYSSPYLTGLPGLPNASPSKNKKRSKTSITKPHLGHKQTDSTNNNSTLSKDNQANFDKSSGDVDKNVLEKIKSAVESTDTPSVNSDIPHQEGDQEVEDPSESSLDAGNANASNGSEAAATNNEPSSSTNEEPAERKDSLRSILKPPPLFKNKSKPVVLDLSIEASKRFAKDAKMKPGKFSKEREPPARTLTKHRHSAPTKIDLFQQQQAQLPNKSPRRRIKLSSGTFAERVGEIPLLPKKSVRFSNKIDVYHVPYEARAGSRACDWQRNMLEQRVQTFRQLMKDVGTEDLDMFGGSGLIFPGYPYHIPDPNFQRGRARSNIKY